MVREMTQVHRIPGPADGRRLARGVLIAAALLLALWLLSNVVLLIFFAVLLAVALRGAADGVARAVGIRRWLALTIVVLALLLAGVAALWWIAPKLASQIQDLASAMSNDARLLQQRYRHAPWLSSLFQHLGRAQVSGVGLENSAELAASVSLRTLSALLVTLVSALYLAISPELYLSGTVRLLPLPYRARGRTVLEEVGQTLRWWMLGQIVDMLAVGGLAAIGLWLAGEPAPLAIALLAGLLTFIPYFGAIITAVPAALVGLAVSWTLALWVLAVFLACHLVEGYVVAPVVQRRMVDLPPALSILSMTLLGTLFGALGIILATPLAAASLVLVRRLYLRDVLEDPLA